MAAARTLRNLAFLCVGTRLFAIYASANRVSASRSLKGALSPDGTLEVFGRPDLYRLVSRARDADSMVLDAFILALVTLGLYLIALIALGVRAKRGETVAKSISANRAFRFAQFLYLCAAGGAVSVQLLFKPDPGAPPRVRIDDLMGQDVGNLVLQVVVITFLLIVGLTVNREIDAAYTDTRTL